MLDKTQDTSHDQDAQEGGRKRQVDVGVGYEEETRQEDGSTSKLVTTYTLQWCLRSFKWGCFYRTVYTFISD